MGIETLPTTRRLAASGRDHPLRRPVAARPLTVAGFALMGAAWWLAWFGPAPWSWYYFFPLWFGYIAGVVGLTRWRTGTSAITRNPTGFARLFAISALLWWGFEAANARLGNWEYLEPTDFGTLGYVALASISFSTVLPALFATAELYRSIGPLRPARHWLRIAPGRAGLLAIATGGGVMVALSLLFPDQAFPLIWLGLFFLLDPLVAFFGGRSIAGQVATGRWDTVWVLFAAGLTCGLLWEGWNYWASPKWIYHLTYAGEPRLFEMPLLGYGGYLPFALELYSAYQVSALLVKRRPDDGLVFDEPAPPAGSNHRR